MSLPSQRIPRYSQCEKIMRVLRDERWHTAAEIHQLAGFSRLNSRISELRKRGYVIEHETTGAGAAGSRYRLISVEEPSDESPSTDSPWASPPPPVAAGRPSPEAPSSTVEQLELVA